MSASRGREGYHWEILGSADEAEARAVATELIASARSPDHHAPPITAELPDDPADGDTIGFVVRPGLIWWLRYRP